MKNWNEEFFTTMYQDMFMDRTKEEINFEKDTITFFTGAKKNQTIADFCCGTGSVLNRFLGDGLTTYGIEFSPDYVKTGQQLYPNSTIVQGDALRYSFGQKFNTVYNWYSSFGYFSDQQNQQLLANMYQHLDTNGTGLIELYNSYHILQNFKKVVTYDKIYQGQKYHITRNSNINYIERLLEQEWTFYNQDTSKTYLTHSKLYFADDVIALMKVIGFKNCRAWETPNLGDSIGYHEINPNSKRIIVVGEK